MPVGVLDERHRAELKASGLTDETIDKGLQAGWFWSATADETKRLGFGRKDAPVGPGLVFEYIGTHPRLCRLKPDVPYKPPGAKKKRKYISLSWFKYKEGNRFYVPGNFARAILQDTKVPLFITEGEKKAIKATQEGFPTIALSGVTSYRNYDRTPDGQKIHPSKPFKDFEIVNWSGRLVYIVYDSDAVDPKKVDIRRAEKALAAELVRRGAKVFICRIPPPTDAENAAFSLAGKIGLDDQLVVRGIEPTKMVVNGALPSEATLRDIQMEDARDTLRNIEKRIVKSPETLYRPEVRGALALAHEEHGPLWGKTLAALKKAKVAQSEINKILKKTKVPFLHIVEPDEQQDKRPTVRSNLKDKCLPELLIPDKFYLSPNGTGSTKDTPDGPLNKRMSLSPIYLSGKLRDLTSGVEHLRVEWRQHDASWRHLIVPRGEVMDSRKLVKSAESGFPVTSNDASEFVEYFKAFEEANQDRLPVARLSWHMGWQGDEQKLGYVAGQTFIKPGGEQVETSEIDKSAPDTWDKETVIFRGADVGDQAKERMVSKSGTLEGWLEAVGKVSKYPRPLLGFYASFVPPLLRILNCANFIVSYAGATTQGKTTSMRLAASIWGRPSESDESGIIASWDNTLVGIERLLTLMNDLPVYLDETQRARHPSTIKEAIYKIGQGQGRGRGSLRGSAATAHFKTVLLSTGEAPITSYHQDGGLRVRVIETRRPPWGTDVLTTKPLIDQMEIDLMEHYGHAGPAFVSYLASIRSDWDELRNMYADTKRMLSTKSVVNPVTGVESKPSAEAGRVAAYGAAIQLAASLAHQVLKLPWQYKDPFNELWHEVVEDLSDAAGDGRALEEVFGWAAAHQFSFFGRHGGNMDGKPIGQAWLGRWDADDNWDRLCILTSHVRDVLTKAGYNFNAVARAWRDKGWTECDPGHIDCKKYRIRGDHPRMIVILRSAYGGL